MNQSAIADPPREAARDRRVAERRAAVADRVWQLTLERGFSGFTIEEVCDEVGISRRTFFNYFPSKEAALIGRPDDGLDENVTEAFVAAGPSAKVSSATGSPAPGTALSPTLFDDLIAIGVSHFDAIGLTAARAAAFSEIVRREPRLVANLIEWGTERDRILLSPTARRERRSEDDPAIVLAVHIAATVIRRSVEDFLAGRAGPTFESVARDRLALTRSLLAPAAHP